MDMSLVDVTALRGRVALGDEAVIIGRQGREEVTADELAAKLDTINYEVVTRIGHRVPRLALHDTCVAPKHENTGVMKGSPHPGPPIRGRGTRSACGAFSR